MKENLNAKGYVISDVNNEDPAVPGFRIEGDFCFEDEAHKEAFEDHLTTTFKLVMVEPHVQTLREFEDEVEQTLEE